MKFNDIKKLLTGFSTPVFGVSWNPPKLESDTAQRLVNELEDRRVLYAPESVEIPHHCVESIIEIRRILTSELHNVNPDSNIAGSIKAMRAACRKFLDSVQENDQIIRFGADIGHFANWRFNSAIGQLRGVFGVHLAQIAVQHGINIEEPLSAILPTEADET